MIVWGRDYLERGSSLTTSCSLLKMTALEPLEDVVHDKIENEQWTHVKLSTYLQQVYPGVKRFSVPSLERFCHSKNIHKTSRLSKQELDYIVADNVTKVRVFLVRS